MFSVLEASDGKKTVGELLEQNGLEDDRRTQFVDEMLDLWSQRFIILRPGK